MQMRLFAAIELPLTSHIDAGGNIKRATESRNSSVKSKCQVEAFTMFILSCSFISIKGAQAFCLSREDIGFAASNHTSFFLDSETNSPVPARNDDHNALIRASLAASKPYENISLSLDHDKKLEDLPLPEIDFDDEDDDDEVAKQLNDGGGTNTDDYDYEDEQEFYKRNPVDTIDFKLEADEDAPPVGHDGAKMKPAKTRKFKNFDDIEALDLKSFYEPESSKGANTRRKRPTQRLRSKKRATVRHVGKLARASERLGAKKRQRLASGVGKRKSFTLSSKNHSVSESREQTQDATMGSPDSCAISLASGQCISFSAIEWSIRRARRLISFSSPSLRSLSSSEPSESSINAVGELNEWTTRVLAIRFGLTPEEVNFGLEQVDVSQTSLWRSCPRILRSPMTRSCATSGAQRAFPGRFRTHTGQCNNPLLPHLGSSFMPFARFILADYADGVGSLRGSPNQLPPARLVSLTLHPNFEQAAEDHSSLFVFWGQLINHDLALASGARAGTGHEGSCCSRSALAQSANPADPLNRVCAPILIGRDDPVYSAHGVRCHDFKRSIAALRPGCSLGPRTQLNLVTSFVDASFVYGSSRSVGDSLRSSNGRLATWNYFGNRRGLAARLKPLLPPQLEAPDEECLGRREGLFCFRSGDQRTNQQVPLVLLHTLHMRQHNRLADGLSAVNPHWPALRLYEEARRIHIAQIQHILLNEYLPLLLGHKLCQNYNLTETRADEYFHGYEPNEQPGISQEFAAAAFRQGHSSVPNLVARYNVATRQVSRLYRLRELFRQPWPLFEPGAVDEFALGLLETPSQSVDPFVSLELTGHLLEEPGEPIGLDLIAINIQRGRDQGVAGYNAAREYCGLARISDFEGLTRVMNNVSAALMANLYESVDDIDLYSGGLSEWPMEGAQVGPTFACIIGNQFRTVRVADRFWFEASPMVAGPQAAFTMGQLASIKQFSLARLVCINSDAIQVIQASAMQLPHPVLNPTIPCDLLPDIDLSEWMELPPVATQEAESEDDE